MNAKQIIKRAEDAAAKCSHDQLSRLSYHVGCLQAEVTMLCHQLKQYTPATNGTETTFRTNSGAELVLHYYADSDGLNDILGIFANGMDILNLVADSKVMTQIEEHCTDHAYIQRKQAAYDLAEQQMEARRDADMEGGAV
jgi:hypothetical protein